MQPKKTRSKIRNKIRNKTRSKRGGALERRWWYDDGEWTHYTWNQWNRAGGDADEWDVAPIALFEGAVLRRDLIPPPDSNSDMYSSEEDDDTDMYSSEEDDGDGSGFVDAAEYHEFAEEAADAARARRHAEAATTTGRPICPPDVGCEDTAAVGCVGGMCKTCDGKDDMITLEAIPEGKGVCIDKQCYDIDTLRDGILLDPKLPHNRAQYTIPDLERAMRQRLKCGDSPRTSASIGVTPRSAAVISDDEDALFFLQALQGVNTYIQDLPEAHAALNAVADKKDGSTDDMAAAEELINLINLVHGQTRIRITPSDARIALEAARGDQQQASAIINNALVPERYRSLSIELPSPDEAAIASLSRAGSRTRYKKSKRRPRKRRPRKTRKH
jgi:hypothetical protein